MATVYLGLGSNIGCREALLRQAIEALEQRIGPLLKCSAFYETAPWGFSSDNAFLNAVAAFSTILSPLDVLTASRSIEELLGRHEKSHKGHYADRPIDIDILYYDQLILSTELLTIPHPLIAQRAFVLEPMADIAPDFIDPALHQTIAQLLTALPPSERLS